MQNTNNKKDYIVTKLCTTNSLNVQYIVTLLEYERPVSFCLKDAINTIDKTGLKNILIDSLFRSGDSSNRFIKAEILNCKEPYKFHYLNAEIPSTDTEIISVTDKVIGLNNELKNPVLTDDQSERLTEIANHT